MSILFLPTHFKISFIYISACNCDRYGSYRQSCDQISGQCECRDTFEGLTCSRCRENFFNFPKCEGKQKLKPKKLKVYVLLNLELYTF